MSAKLRVLVVDDSATIRSLLVRILSSDEEIEVVGTAPDAYVAREKLVALEPDLMTLDVDMPKMDGITFLEKVMQHFPTRTVIVSALTGPGSDSALRALELGAIDVIEKHELGDSASEGAVSTSLILERIKAAGRARMLRFKSPTLQTKGSPTPARTRAPTPAVSAQKSTREIIAIASSTGGPEALKVVLPALSADLPGIVIVQHMPPGFTQTYARSLQKLCAFEVKEAEHGDKIFPGRALIAPGNFHMEVDRRGGSYFVVLHQQPQIFGLRPAADYLLKSVAKYAGDKAIGVVLTGMGKDGAVGLLEMRKAGAYTIAQDEASCVVYGMPKAAVEIGAIQTQAPLPKIARLIESHVRSSSNKTKIAAG